MSAAALQSFGFGDQLVRAMDREGLIWFVAKDVCAALNIANSRDALEKLDDDEKGVGSADTLGGTQQVQIISEGGAYTLVLRCRDAMKAGSVAHRFRKWLTNEVLPAIRMTGRYEPANDITDPEPSEPLADETERLRLQLNLVREARIAFGTRGARRAWAIAGLPDLGLSEAPPLLSGAVAVVGKLHQSVAEWMDARTEAAPGHRVPSMTLFHDYLEWAKREGINRCDIVSLTAFGRALSNCGIGGHRSNVMHRLGLRLIDQ